MIQSWVLGPVELAFELHFKRRNPHRIITVDGVGQADEFLQVGRGGNGVDFHGCRVSGIRHPVSGIGFEVRDSKASFEF